MVEFKLGGGKPKVKALNVLSVLAGHPPDTFDSYYTHRSAPVRTFVDTAVEEDGNDRNAEISLINPLTWPSTQIKSQKTPPDGAFAHYDREWAKRDCTIPVNGAVRRKKWHIRRQVRYDEISANCTEMTLKPMEYFLEMFQHPQLVALKKLTNILLLKGGKRQFTPGWMLKFFGF